MLKSQVKVYPLGPLRGIFMLASLRAQYKAILEQGAMQYNIPYCKIIVLKLYNFSYFMTKEIASVIQVKPTVNQIECHPYLNQHRLMAFCNANNIRITAYSPLGCKDRLWTSPLDDQPLLEHTTLQGIAKKHKKSIAQILLRWQVMFLSK